VVVFSFFFSIFSIFFSFSLFGPLCVWRNVVYSKEFWLEHGVPVHHGFNTPSERGLLREREKKGKKKWIF